MSVQSPNTSVVWDEETGTFIELSLDQRIHMVVEGIIIWCDVHQCFHWLPCSSALVSKQVH